MDGSGVEGRGGRGGQGRAGQGRVPDCLGGLSRVGISSCSTRPWNGQPPSVYNIEIAVSGWDGKATGAALHHHRQNLGKEIRTTMPD